MLIGAHLTLDGTDGFVRIADRLTLCQIADKTLAGLAERNDRRRGTAAFGVGNNSGLTHFHNCYAGIGRSEIDTDNFITHGEILLIFLMDFSSLL